MTGRETESHFTLAQLAKSKFTSWLLRYLCIPQFYCNIIASGKNNFFHIFVLFVSGVIIMERCLEDEIGRCLVFEEEME